VQKIKTLERMLSAEFDLDYRYSNQQIDVDTTSKEYMIQVSVNDEATRYAKTIAIDNFLSDIASRSPHRIMKWLFWFRPRNKPKNIFLISEHNLQKTMAWLRQNLNPLDYQIYSKFDTDISISFRKDEHAVLYKLVFGN
jgi:hypothetical protein